MYIIKEKWKEKYKIIKNEIRKYTQCFFTQFITLTHSFIKSIEQILVCLKDKLEL